jgi:predicted metal-dependent peptidase
MAVSARDGRVRFYYTSAFVFECKPEELEAVIHHELNHVVFRHPFTDRTDYPNRHARTIAEEVTVNEHVPEPLPGNPLTIKEFPELPAGEDTHTRYHRLAERTDLADKVRILDDHALWDENGSADGISVLMPELLRPDLEGKVSEALWRAMILAKQTSDVESLPPTTKPIRPLGWGRILGSLLGARAQLEATFQRPPRRLPDLVGIFPGNTCRSAKPQALVAIDTSGSMTTPLFEQIRAELDRIRELVEVTVVECDKLIRKTHRLNGRLQEINGRGGTDLRPPFARAVIDSIRPAVIIYFTDGKGKAPRLAPKIPVIWCLTHSAKRPASWGTVVHMPPSNGDQTSRFRRMRVKAPDMSPQQ